MRAVPAAVESIWKPEGAYLKYLSGAQQPPQKVAQATSIMAEDQIRSDRGKWSERDKANRSCHYQKKEIPPL
jgi:hypothetical protein